MKFVLMLFAILAMATSNACGSSPASPSATASPTPTPTLTGVSLSSIHSKSLGRDLVSGDVISIPDTLTVRGVYHVADPQPGVRYGVFSALKLASSKAVPKSVSSILPAAQEGAWATAYEITGLPSSSEDGGPRQYFDITDVVQMSVGDSVNGGVSLILTTTTFVIRYKTSP